ncbi:MAG: TatD family hydrolase [Bacteroides sp.]
MELPIDVHTHRTPDGIINIRWPEAFNPQPGQYYSVGIHPWDAHRFNEKEIDWNHFEQLASHPQIVAVGECGIDKCVNRELLLRQESLFVQQLCISEKTKKPVIIHNVRSTSLIRSYKRRQTKNLPWILHGFRGKEAEACGALEDGFYLSFGARYNEETICSVPLHLLLVETDDSTLDILEIYRRIAASRKMPVKELITAVRQNVRQVFFKGQEL